MSIPKQNSFFEEIPRLRFLSRILPPCIILGMAIFLAIKTLVPPSQLDFWQYNLFHMPKVCTGGPTTDFEKNQCNDFWTSLVWSLFYTTAPFLGTLTSFWAARAYFLSFYARLGKQIELHYDRTVPVEFRSPAQPLLSRFDLFRWFFCLQSRVVDLKGHPKVTVYFPLGDISSHEVLIFEVSGRRFGLPYSPHVAVIRGS